MPRAHKSFAGMDAIEVRAMEIRTTMYHEASREQGTNANRNRYIRYYEEICEARGKGPHHAFDSYEGLSEPAEEDRVTHEDQLDWHAGDMSASEELVRANLHEFPWVQYHRGWIPERFPEVADRQFCFVHVDVDLHQPTLDSLEFFFRHPPPDSPVATNVHSMRWMTARNASAR